MKTYRQLVFAFAILCSVCGPASAAVRIKDITHIEGVRANQLYGLGLVIGLDGTGAQQQSRATRQLAIDMLRKMDVTAKIALQQLEDNVFTSNSIAMVMVTAELSAFAREGSRLDVVVSVIDTASSLEGGTLLFTPLKGADGEVYAVAQGSVSVGGFDLSLLPQITGNRNHPTVGRLPRGGIVEREALGTMTRNGRVRLLLDQPDFTTARLISDAVNGRFAQFAVGAGSRPARAPFELVSLKQDMAQWNGPVSSGSPRLSRTIDGGTVEVIVPPRLRGAVVEFISEIGKLEITPDTPARVVINERTGTVIVGRNVKISPVAISHGNLVIRPIAEEPPPPPGPGAQALLGLQPGQQQAQAAAPFDGGFGGQQGPLGDSLNVFKQTSTVAELARALNALGVSPRDLISLFQALKQAGALHADLVVM